MIILAAKITLFHFIRHVLNEIKNILAAKIILALQLK